MSSIAIKVENLSKKYIIGSGTSGSLRETLSNTFRKSLSISKMLSDEEKAAKEEFWALRDINFEIKQGEAVGIIGRNGAGKSTLLKLLSKITYPTTGKITMNGRVSSLLEVGTGFHPELTGRENIYLNGTILGMSRKEVKSKFDEIVGFSGIGKFLDTPVKRYSSGMYVRLAFAVAAHLEPEILIIDEVLAVGDAEFQKKCLGKMDEVAKGGRTVLFVSHNMGAIDSLCNKGILLKNGNLLFNGNAEDTISKYTFENKSIAAEKKWDTLKPAFQDESVKLLKIGITNSKVLKVNNEIELELDYQIIKSGIKPIPNIHIFTSTGQKLFVSVNPNHEIPKDPGNYKSILKIPSNFFNEGSYKVGVALSTLEPLIVHAYDYNAFTFDVIDDLDSITRNNYKGKFDGMIRPLFNWETQKL